MACLLPYSSPLPPDTVNEIPAGAIRVIASDLDATLLASSHTVPLATAAYLRTLHERGVPVVVATGRSIRTALPLCEALDLASPTPVFLVCFNGSCAIRLLPSPHWAAYHETGALEAVVELPPLLSRPLDPAVARDVLEISRDLGCATQYYVRDGDVLAECSTEAHRDLCRRYRELTGRDQIFCADGPGDLDRAAAAHDSEAGTPMKILIMTDDPGGVFAAVRERLPAERAHVISAEFFVEVLMPATDKADALGRVCGALGVEMAEHMAFFGDGNNDVEALRRCRLGVAMRNGTDAALAAGDRVTAGSNDEEGVMRFVRGLEECGALAGGAGGGRGGGVGLEKEDGEEVVSQKSEA